MVQPIYPPPASPPRPPYRPPQPSRVTTADVRRANERLRLEKIEHIERLKQETRPFEEATGLSFGGRWGSPPIETIKLAQRLEKLSSYDRDKMFGKLEAVAADLERTVKTIREALAGDEPQGDAG
jgi:hypothetical protein